MFITLPDGRKFELQEKQNGHDVALALSPSLAKKALAYRLDNELFDLAEPIKNPGNFSLVLNDDPDALHLLRHSTSHLLAHAIQNLFPQALFGFGPAIEDGFYYDIDFQSQVVTDADFVKIEAEMRRISQQNVPISRRVLTREAARELFSKNPYKQELIAEISEPISAYQQDNFVDLCSGPHVPSTGFIKHFKLLSIAGAYWRGNSDNIMLTRIYGTVFFTDQDLKDYLYRIEEAKKRDHRKLGKELGLFMISDYGPGMPFWLPKGMIVRNLLENFWYDIHTEEGYQFIKTPIMLNKQLWEISGHWLNYRDNMYVAQIDEQDFAIKPMNCPGGILVYKSELHSYKDLPIRVGELGLVHRHEASGALNGLFRVRAFTQDDAHIYCRPDQLLSEIQRLLKLFDKIYSVFGLSYHIELSTRPENKYIGEIAVWDFSEKVLAEACSSLGKDYKLNLGDGAFYGPKLDFKLRDSLGRIWQCGTIQLDMNLPERFDMTYIDENNEKQRPVMLHRAIYGSIERFIGILIEHFAGAFPTWLAPVQVSVLPVNAQYHSEFALELENIFKANKIRVSLDASSEKLGYRLRKAVIDKIPYALVVGDQEVANKQVTYRRYGSQKQVTVSIDEFIALIKNEIDDKALLAVDD